MPTATGSVVSTDGSKFSAVFVINNVQYTYSGDINPPIKDAQGAPVRFSSSSATLDYQLISDLTATRPYEGQVGVDAVNIKTSNGPIIKGNLNTQLAAENKTSASGTWTSA